MPTIDVSYKDLCSLIGRQIEIQKLTNEDILFAKGEVDGIAGDTIKIDSKDTNRPDLWSAEGVARQIRYKYRTGFPDYKTKKSSIVVNVDKSVNDVRPLTVCAVVRGLKINDTVLSQLIQLQEKIAGTFGRNRKDVAIGVYDADKIKSPIRYTTVSPSGIKFVPLDFEKELTPQEILEKHPKGKEFGHLLKGAQRYPVFIDSANNVLSLPPIINSAYTGKVTEKTRNVFIECSGFDFKFLTPSLNVIVTALHERGGTIETVTVNYPGKKIEMPDLKPKKFTIDADYINKISGLGLDKKAIVDLLTSFGYRAKMRGNKLDLLYPAYRQDMMHARDVVEDVIISYGYNKIEPEAKELVTSGRMVEIEKFSGNVTDILIGCGLQEIMSYTLTNKRDLFEKMNVDNEKIVEIENPVSANWSVFRSGLTPSIMDFLSKNKHVEYPQKIFEIGNCTIPDEKMETRAKDIRKLAAGISSPAVSYEDISSILDALMKNLGMDYKLKKHEHRSFIAGRCAEIVVKNKNLGIIGEVHPIVLNRWKLEKPVVVFELDLSEVFAIKNK